jgi:hypothetical protein
MVFYKVQLNWRLERREQKREETTRLKKEVQARQSIFCQKKKGRKYMDPVW